MITKRLLGLGLILSSLAALLGLFILDAMGFGDYGGAGPFQRNLYIALGITFLLGLSLLPLGDKPA